MNKVDVNISHNKRSKSIRFFRFMSRMLKVGSVRPRRNIAPTIILKEHANIKTNMLKMNEQGYVPGRSPKFPNQNQNEGSKKYRKLLAQHLEEYCTNTTLHGLRYIGDNKLAIGERIFWFAAFCCAVGFVSYYIQNVYDKWNSSPVIISFSPFDADLNSIPFPAVTICNMNQAKKSEAEKLIAEGDPVQLKMLSDVCNDNQHFNETIEYNWTTLSTFLIRTGSSCSDMVKKCEWSGQTRNCKDLFNNYLTDEGLCCSFNRLPPNKIFKNPNIISLLNQSHPKNVFDWSPETGFQGFPFKGETDETIVPKRPLGAGAHLGLTVVIDAEVDNYYCSSTSSVGFKILISNPIETPKMADFASLLRTGVEARYSIVPSVREASNKLKNIDLSKRQCYFANERQLLYYRKYTYNHCRLECNSYYMNKYCDCVPYYLPKNSSMRYCLKTDSECVETARRMVDLGLAQSSLCKCYPECVTINYDTQYSFIKLRKVFSGQNTQLNRMNDSYIRGNVAVIYFSFNQDHFDKQYKSNLFDGTDIIGNIGGLLGVFMGFSILSAIEFIYLMIWRFFRENCKSKEPEQPIYPFVN